MNRAERLVIGSGIVGLTAAIAMRQLGYHVVVLEKYDADMPARSDVSRVYAINQASCSLLQQLGVWDALRRTTEISTYQRMQVWDVLGEAKIDFDAAMIVSDHLGYMVEESLLKTILMSCAKNLGINIVSNYHVHQINPVLNQHTIQVSDGISTWLTELVIIADGAKSEARDILNIPIVNWSYHQQALVATIQTEQSHQKTAYQAFLKYGPLALLPMADPYQCSMVWSTTPQHASQLLTLSDQDFNAYLMDAFGSKLGKLFSLTPRRSFPLEMRHVTQYAGPGWVVIGDAAHTIHPLAGLGLNVGLADLASWFVLEKARLARDKYLKNSYAQPFGWSEREIGAYQRERKTNVWKIIVLLEMLHRLFRQSSSGIIGLRAVGLTLTNRFMPLKRLLIEYAMGKR